MNECVLRLAYAEELPRVFELKRQIHQLHVDGDPERFKPIRSMEDFVQHASGEGMHLLLAEYNGEVLAYALLREIHRPETVNMLPRNAMEVDEFCVGESVRRMGIGRKLMQKVLQFSKEKGFSRLELNVWSFNDDAMRFYEAFGFQTERLYMKMNLNNE